MRRKKLPQKICNRTVLERMNAAKALTEYSDSVHVRFDPLEEVHLVEAVVAPLPSGTTQGKVDIGGS